MLNTSHSTMHEPIVIPILLRRLSVEGLNVLYVEYYDRCEAELSRSHFAH